MWNIKHWRQKVRIRLSAARPVLKKRSHLGSMFVNDAHISDTVHGKVQMFGKFPELSKFILQRQTADLLTGLLVPFGWLHQMKGLGPLEYTCVETCVMMCMCFLKKKKKKKKNSKRKSLGKIVYPADFYCPSYMWKHLQKNCTFAGTVRPNFLWSCVLGMSISVHSQMSNIIKAQFCHWSN